MPEKTLNKPKKASSAKSSPDKGNAFNAFIPTRQLLDKIYEIRGCFSGVRFAGDDERNATLDKLVNETHQSLTLVPPENRKSATYEYLIGKLYNCYSVYQKEAEDHLCNAVLLDSSLGDAWASLGYCMEKKGEKMAARTYLMMALTKVRSKKILCQLSVLESKMTGGKDKKLVNVLVKESMKHAREALMLDEADGYSWFCLGSALLQSFIYVRKDLDKLRESQKAFSRAEKDKKMKCFPNLYFNGACVNKYLGNYKAALEGFELAVLNDSPLDAELEIRKMVKVFEQICVLLDVHKQYKDRGIMESSLEDIQLDPLYKRATFDNLKEGVNKSFAVVGNVLISVANEDHTARYYPLIDSDQQCYIIVVYGTRTDIIKAGDQVIVLDPCYNHYDFVWKGKKYVFEALRVDSPLQDLRVNGETVSPDNIEKRGWKSMVVTRKPEAKAD